jgi:hypothetical protein
MPYFEIIIKIIDVIIKFIALIFPIVLFRKQILHFSNLISSDIKIIDSRSKYFPKGTIGVECIKGKLINTCLTLLLIEKNKCTPIKFKNINGLTYLNLGNITEKSNITIELTDTDVFDLLNDKLSHIKDEHYLLALVTYSEKYDKRTIVKEELLTIYDPGEYILTDDDKKINDTGLAVRNIGLPTDMIKDKKLRKNNDNNKFLQKKIIEEISNTCKIGYSSVKMAYCIPKVIFRYFDEKNKKLIRDIKK